VMHRNVHCIYNGKTAKEHGYIKCDPATEPSHTQKCYKINGCNLEWHTSEWGPVSMNTVEYCDDEMKYIVLIV